jgi:hypothetical protein
MNRIDAPQRNRHFLVQEDDRVRLWQHFGKARKKAARHQM